MTDEYIPVANPKAQFERHEDEIRHAVNRTLKSGWYILGPEVSEFEKEFAEYTGTSHSIGTGSGTDALILALKACGTHPGHEVITVSHSAVATVSAIESAGAIPVFVDIDPETRCLDPDKVMAMVSEKTSAIIPVHIYGQPASMETITEIAAQYGLSVIEDCAQAHGACINNKKVGSFGHAGAFSFYPTKNLGAIGDGGAVVTNADKIAKKIRALRQYGWEKRCISEFKGMNSRLDEIQAAVLRVKIKHIDADNARRRAIASRYRMAVEGTSIIPPKTVTGTLHAMHLFVVECSHRDSLISWLDAHGIGTAIHYPLPVHEQPAYKKKIKGCDKLQATEALYSRILSLPMYPELTDFQVTRICNALKTWRPPR
jgi:dTDP-4-amino-4,6-dideoxygalactose transaminase